MTIDEIRELIRLASETGVAELEVQRGENRVRIRNAGRESTGIDLSAFTTHAAAASVPPPVAAPAPVAPLPEPQKEPQGPPTDMVYVKSPIVGTFYESASPGTPPFVRIGEHVTAGKVLCIIESMKLMNEIEADVSGVVESCIVKNGQPVEYGEALFGIRPV